MIPFTLSEWLPNLLAVLSIFTIGVASPGPATLMIVGTAMGHGRSQAVALSIGVVAGSMVWAAVAAAGFVAALETSATLFTALRLVGGLYLLVLAVKALRSALGVEPKAAVRSAGESGLRRCFLQGLLLHLSNPKAPLVWLATLTVAILLCAVTATAVFVGYAFLFSTPAVSRAYLAARRPVDATIGVLFGAAAVKVLTYRPS